MSVVSAVAGVPSAEELSALPAAELAVRLAEAYRLIGELTAQVERLSARMGQLERRARKDSSTSSRPPSSDSPCKKGGDRSPREHATRPGRPPRALAAPDPEDYRLLLSAPSLADETEQYLRRRLQGGS